MDTKCHKCNKEFKQGDTVVKYHKHLYHQHCFDKLVDQFEIWIDGNEYFTDIYLKTKGR